MDIFKIDKGLPVPIIMIATIAVQIMCVVHVMRTGRNTYWIMFIIMAPLIGAIAYFIVEILPGASKSPQAGKLKKSAVKILDPSREYRAAKDALNETSSTDNYLRMAAAAAATEHYDEALEFYEVALVGPFAHHPESLVKLATVQYALGNHQTCLDTLDRCKTHNPNFDSQEGHLLHAMALQALGRMDEAASSFEALVVYALGEEARVRYGLLLRDMGDEEAAAEMFAETIARYNRSPKHYQRREKAWYNTARNNL